jgi:uncharacterized radical SAM superfamily protein
MFDNHHADDVEDADDIYSVDSYLESNPVWLFNTELLSKIGNKASEHVSIGIDFKQAEWNNNKLLQNPILLQPVNFNEDIDYLIHAFLN